MENGNSRFEPSPFSNPGRWVKAGFHCHTTASDGGLSTEETVTRYRDKGYTCLGITDHRTVTATEALTTDEFVGINSIENGGFPDVIGVGVDHGIPVDRPFPEKVRGLAEQGGFTIAAHPAYCGVIPDDYMACPDLMALEIYNAYCDDAYANGYALELWDMLLGLGKRIYGVAGDDAHLNPEKGWYSNAGLGWCEIWTDSFTRDGLLQALKDGAFYATQGPRFLSFEVDGPTLRFTCTPVAQVRWRTFGHEGRVFRPDPHASPAPLGQNPPRSAPDAALGNDQRRPNPSHTNDLLRTAPGPALTHGELPPSFKPRIFVRIELLDHHGKRAWSNPFFVIREE